jgi:hypothetical protein
VFQELAGINKYWVEGGGPGVNCASCAMATADRLSGANTTALAAPNSRPISGTNEFLPNAPFGFQGVTTPSSIQEAILAGGNGARGIVLIGEYNAAGSWVGQHAINVVNRDGVVYFIDAQIGKIVFLKPNLSVKLGLPL